MGMMGSGNGIMEWWNGGYSIPDTGCWKAGMMEWWNNGIMVKSM